MCTALLARHFAHAVAAREHSGGDGEEWKACKSLLSALLPDLTTLLHEGRLDSLAMNDCCTFMNTVISQTYSRNANGWALERA